MRIYSHQFALAAGMTMAIVRAIKMILGYMPGCFHIVKAEGTFFAHLEERTLLVQPAFFDYAVRLLFTFTTTYLFIYLFAFLYNKFIAADQEDL